MRSQLRLGLAVLWLIAVVSVAAVVAWAVLRGVYAVPLRDESFRFERPWAALLLLGPALGWLAGAWLQRGARPRLRISRGAAAKTLPLTWRARVTDLPPALRAGALGLAVFALMGPQSIHARDSAELSGIEIIVTLDMSKSMEAADIKPTRFDATKAVVQDFITRRPNDRIGAVVFGKDAYTLLPLTTDRDALRTALRGLALEQIDARGTAIGNAVGVALNRLRRSRAKSKVVILLTDGESNAGNISPVQAAELAAAMGVKVYPILMGVSDNAPVQQGTGIFGRTIWGQANYPVNPELLKKIAEQTGGEFFGVNDREGLERSFHHILDRLEKSEIEDAGRVYAELYPAFLAPAALLLLVELLFGAAVLRRWP